jgi:glycosyltransferase involved in cell wall biosynthesis
MQQMDCPESFTKPQRVRHAALKRNMDFTALTDHDTLEGVKQIEHHGDVLRGSEITTFFPDGVAAHVLCYGMTDNQFGAINELRRNIVEFVKYLRQEDIVHVCAHPLHKVNGKTTWDHFEQMILLFKHFEIINGSRLCRVNEAAEMVLRHLNEDHIEDLAFIHGIEPTYDKPWEKYFTAGSDDHSGLYIGTTYTEVDVEEKSISGLLDGIRHGRTRACGVSSGSFTLAHMCGSIAYQYYKDRFGVNKTELFQLLGRLLDPEHPTPPRWLQSVQNKMQRTKEYFFRKNKATHDLYFSIKEKIETSEPLEQLLNHVNLSREEFNHNFSELTADTLDTMIQTLLKRPAVIPQFITYAPLLLTSYLCSSNNLYDEEDLIARANEVLDRDIQPKVAWFTDSFVNMDGVSKTCKAFLQSAKKRGLDLTMITCSDEDLSEIDGVQNFEPIHSFALPGYEKVQQHLPSIIRVMRYLESQEFNSFVISTPGPVGLLGLLFSKLFHVPAYGIYHTDLPRIAMRVSNDTFFSQVALGITKTFYSQMNKVFAPCKRYARDVEQMNVPVERVKILERWVDTNQFSPKKKDLCYWDVKEPIKLLFVGRISKDKNPELLLKTYQKLSERHDNFVMNVVGDGPFFDEMKEQTRHWDRFHMTGAKYGDDLAIAFASSDIFIYPGLLDTFGNVVIEAQASGLPCVVMNEGGPPELVKPGETGFIAQCESEFIQLTEKLILQRENRQWMSQRAAAYAAERFSEPLIFETFWDEITSKSTTHAEPSTVFDFNRSGDNLITLSA